MLVNPRVACARPASRFYACTLTFTFIFTFEYRFDYIKKEENLFVPKINKMLSLLV